MTGMSTHVKRGGKYWNVNLAAEFETELERQTKVFGQKPGSWVVKCEMQRLDFVPAYRRPLA